MGAALKDALQRNGLGVAEQARAGGAKAEDGAPAAKKLCTKAAKQTSMYGPDEPAEQDSDLLEGDPPRFDGSQRKHTTPAGGGTGPKNITGRWYKQEHAKFLQGLKLYGKQWKKISGIVQTRTAIQVKSHAQKYFEKIKAFGALASNDVHTNREL